MNLPRFKWIQPSSLKEALTALREYDGNAALMAGGTAFIVYLRYRLRKPETVIGLKELTELKEISRNEDGGLSIGAMVNLVTLETSPLILKECPSLSQAARMVAVPPIRQEATLGGNICLDTRCIFYNQSETWRTGKKACFKLGGQVCHAVDKGRRCQSVYQGDLAPVLMAMGAQVKIASKDEERILPLSDFFTGKGEKPNLLRADEILVEIRIPPLTGVTITYEKLRVREGMDFPMAAVAAMVKKDPDGRIEQARSILGAVGSSPIEVSDVGSRLEGETPSEDLIESLSRIAMEQAHPVENLAIQASYRRKMVGVLTRRAFRRALEMPSNRT